MDHVYPEPQVQIQRAESDDGTGIYRADNPGPLRLKADAVSGIVDLGMSPTMRERTKEIKGPEVVQRIAAYPEGLDISVTKRAIRAFTNIDGRVQW